MEKEQPIQPDLIHEMNAFAKALDEFLNSETKKWAFALFIFPFGQGEDHRSNYISNANREDMIATLKEFVARAEGRFIE